MPTEQARNASREALNSFASELDTMRERVTEDLKVVQALDFARRMGELHLQARTAVQLVDLTLEDEMAWRYTRSRERTRKALLTWAEEWDRA